MQGNAEASGEVVVAEADGAEGVAMRPLAARRRQGESEAAEHLDRRGDFLRSEAVITVAALAVDGEQPAFDQPREVGAGSRCADAGDAGQLAGGQRLAAQQGLQHRGAGGIA